MIRIGRIYTETVGSQARLCAQVSVGNRSTVLWFGVEEEFAQYFTQRSDPFLLALLPMAMRRGLDIYCENPVTQRLLYQLQMFHIPTMIAVGNGKKMCIHAETVSGAEGIGFARATGFTGGVDSLYTIMRHTACDVPQDFALTHLTVFNVGAFKGENYRDGFARACEFASRFAREYGFKLVCVDTNFNDVLCTTASVNGLHSISSEVSYRIFSAALALRGLFSAYYLSTDTTFRAFTLDPKKSSVNSCYYDLFTVMSCSVDGLTFYPTGGEATRVEKLIALSDWAPSYGWLHSCFTAEGNCGICRKCVAAQVVFECLGKLDRYASVFDTEKFMENRENFLAMSISDSGHSYEKELAELVHKNLTITPRIRQKARMIRAAVQATDTYFKGKGTDVPFGWR